MSVWGKLRERLGRSYRVWRLYHLLVADAVSIQKPTKFRIVREYLGDDLGMVVDIGCGPGVFTRYLCAHAKWVWAGDIDAASLARVKARHRDQKNLALVVTAADRLPFSDSCFDTLLFLEVLEHLPDDAAGVRELFRISKPGGRMVLSVPVPPGEVDNENPWGHKREGYPPAQLVGLLERNGFRVEKQSYAEFKFSRSAARWIRRWRQWLHLPAPIFLSWVAYLDHFLDSAARQKGEFLPATVVILAKRERMSVGR